jgi:hypothetical protein
MRNVVLDRDREDAVVDEPAHGLLDQPLLVGELEVHERECTGVRIRVGVGHPRNGFVKIRLKLSIGDDREDETQAQARRRLVALGVSGVLAVATFVGLASAGGIGGTAGTFPAAADQYAPRVTICHRVRANRYRTITVVRRALPAHLRHGDTLGPCSTRLNAAVGARVTLTTADGRRVTRIRRATLWVVVSDRSRRANFHLAGPGVDRRTAVRFTGTARWRVGFVPGSYRYFADVGASGGGSFVVR